MSAIDPHDPSSDDPLSEPRRMLDLLSMDSAQSSWMPDELGAILVHQLDTPLRHEIGGQLPGDWDAADATVRRLLLHEQPPATLLEQLKIHFKAAAQNANGPLPKEIATVLYVATLVAARRAGHDLTKLDDAALRDKVQWATRRLWLDPALAGTMREFLVG